MGHLLLLGAASSAVDGGIQVSYSEYSRVVSLLVLLPTVSIGQRAQEDVAPLKNWATPLYWQPNQAEREVAGKAVPQLQFSANAVSTNALTFIAITPCRLVDTRGAAAGFIGVTPFNGRAFQPEEETSRSRCNRPPKPAPRPRPAVRFLPSPQRIRLISRLCRLREALWIMSACGPQTAHNHSSRP